ncbi:hypothetical protein C0991_010989, partial [Blastosporella zonata]
GKILAIACDNASNNDTMVVKLVCFLPKFRSQKTCVWCFLHILNLVTKIIIRQFDNSKKEEAELVLQEYLDWTEENKDEENGEEEEEEEEMEDEGEDNDNDDKIGEDEIRPVRMVLNKNSSTLLLPEWFKILENHDLASRMLPHDVKTQWNSTYDMLTIAVQYRTAIDELTANRTFQLRKYELSKKEWIMAAQLSKVLKVFKDATLAFSQSSANVANVLPAIDHITKVLEEDAN